MQCGVVLSFGITWPILPESHLPCMRLGACSFSLARFRAGERSQPHFLWSAPAEPIR